MLSLPEFSITRIQVPLIDWPCNRDNGWAGWNEPVNGARANRLLIDRNAESSKVVPVKFRGIPNACGLRPVVKDDRRAVRRDQGEDQVGSRWSR